MQVKNTYSLGSTRGGSLYERNEKKKKKLIEW